MEENRTTSQHATEEQLVLLYYGEAEDAPVIESHLSSCDTCRAGYRALQSVLNTVDAAPVPARGPEYGSAVWRRIEKRIGVRRRTGWFPWWMWAPVTAALVLLAFWAGRISPRPGAPTLASGQVRERILLVAVGDHLERSQMVLAEISNAPETKGSTDISDERRQAADLLDSNRLFRQTAASTGDTNVATVLDDLERVLLEIAHSPSEVDSEHLNELQREINDRGLLFKIRVIGSQVQQEEAAPVKKQAPGRT